MDVALEFAELQLEARREEAAAAAAAAAVWHEDGGGGGGGGGRGGRGRGGGGGNRRGGKACFICGSLEHLKRDCPQLPRLLENAEAR